MRYLLDAAKLTIAGSVVTGFSYPSQADSVFQDSVIYYASAKSTAGPDDYQFSTGPIINLVSNTTSIAAGMIIADGEGSAWPGGLNVAQGKILVSSVMDNGYIDASTQTSTPGQPIPDFPADFFYAAIAGAEVTGSLIYDLYVKGPPGTVQLTVKAASEVVGSRLTGGGAQYINSTYQFEGLIDDTLSLSYGTGVSGPSIEGTGNYYASGNAETGYVAGIAEDGIYTVKTCQLYEIVLSASISSYSWTTTYGNDKNTYFSAPGDPSGSVTIDPSYEIAPGTVNAGDYTILLTPGVSAGAPEPSTWILMSSGLLGAGFVSRARRAKRTHVRAVLGGVVAGDG